MGMNGKVPLLSWGTPPTWVPLGLGLASDPDPGRVEEDVLRVVSRSPLHEPPDPFVAVL